MKTVRPRLSSTSRSGLRDVGFAGQLIAAAGAAFALLGAFGVGFVAVGVGCLILGVVISAPYACNPGPFIAEWWTVLAVAAFICLAGLALSFVVAPLGGVLATAAAVVALVAVALGSPPEQSQGTTSSRWIASSYSNPSWIKAGRMRPGHFGKE